MKFQFITALFLIFIYNTGIAQISVEDVKNIDNTAKFKEEKGSLVRVMSKSLRYPIEMAGDPDAVTVLGVIKLSSTGKIEEIGTLNKVNRSFKNQFVKFAKETEGMWETAGDSSLKYYAIIPIHFTYDGADYSPNLSNKPEYFQNASSIIFSSEVGNYNQDGEYLSKVERLISKQKFQKAVDVMEILLSREPTNIDYYKKIIELNEKLNNTEDAMYYQEVLKIFDSNHLSKS